MLRNGNKRARGGKRRGAGRKKSLATILKERFIADKENEAEASFSFLCALRDNPNEHAKYRVQAAAIIMDRTWGRAKERIELSWREKAKEHGYDPDEILQQVATAIAERDFGGSDSGGTGTTATTESEEISE